MKIEIPSTISAAVVAAKSGADKFIAIFIGYATKYMAWMCIFYTMVMACVTHQFWGVEPGLQAREAMNFLQAFGSAGGFLLLIALGPGKFSVDQLLKEPVSPTPTPAAETKS
jgi:putative oxidoreductase